LLMGMAPLFVLLATFCLLVFVQVRRNSFPFFLSCPGSFNQESLQFLYTSPPSPTAPNLFFFVSCSGWIILSLELDPPTAHPILICLLTPSFSIFSPGFEIERQWRTPSPPSDPLPRLRSVLCLSPPRPAPPCGAETAEDRVLFPPSFLTLLFPPGMGFPPLCSFSGPVFSDLSIEPPAY